MIVVGLDSAELTGYAVVAAGPRERLTHHGTFTISGAADVEQAVATLAAMKPDLVAVEAPYVRLNAATGLTLAVLLGRWLQAWERRGVATATVLASTWQIQILGGLVDRRSDRATRKRAARLWTRSTFAVELGEDEADAAGIATWAARRAVMDQRTRVAGSR